MKPLNICVVGLGYIGLPTASLLATKGCNVLGVDVNGAVVDTINAGHIHIVEPDLDALVRIAVKSGRLRASCTPQRADVFIIAVPTPFKDDHQPDMRHVHEATKQIAAHLCVGDLVILESTSPVGSTEVLAEIIAAQRNDLVTADGLAVDLAHCPERVMPGNILHEIVNNDRIVGGLTEEATTRAAAFYRSFVIGNILTTNCRTAELAKLTENASRDVNIAFANELSLICHNLNIDVWELIRLANHHPRVNILQPGPGVGGHCIAVDPWFIVSAAPESSQLIQTARQINDSKVDWVVNRVLGRAQRLKEPIIGCMGLTYKPNIDDLRQSPALEITKRLIAALPDAEVLACEPHLQRCEGVRLHPVETVLQRADIIVGLVSHRQFRNLPRIHLEGKMVIDVCGVFL